MRLEYRKELEIKGKKWKFMTTSNAGMQRAFVECYIKMRYEKQPEV
jgi:hypothetical protein